MIGAVVMAVLALGALVCITGYAVNSKKADDGTSEDAVPVDVKTETGESQE